MKFNEIVMHIVFHPTKKYSGMFLMNSQFIDTIHDERKCYHLLTPQQVEISLFVMNRFAKKYKKMMIRIVAF